MEIILAERLIKPQPFSDSDTINPQLEFLQKNSIFCTWFSSQNWSSNIFGGYIFEHNSNDLVLSELVLLDDHNGARCYLSSPSTLAKWIATELNTTTINSSSDPSWCKQNKEDRVDILVSWSVPSSRKIAFTSSAKVGNELIEQDANFTKARFWARMLLDNNHDFDNTVTDYIPLAALLLRWLTGNYDSAFKSAQERVGSDILENPPNELFNASLMALIEPDVSIASECSAHIGDFGKVAEVVAGRVNTHFKQTISVEDVIKAIN